MFKFKSICPMSLIVTVDGVMRSIKPNQEFTSKNYINNNFIVECVIKEVIPPTPQVITKLNDTSKNYKKQIKDES